MHRRSTGNYLLVVAILVLIYIVVTDRIEQRTGLIKYKHVVNIDTAKIDTAAVNSIKKLKAVDSIIKQDRQKQALLLIEGQRIKDSIALAHKQILELKRSLEKEKRQIKEKYEKHIEKIYESNCIQRGGPEDTISHY